MRFAVLGSVQVLTDRGEPVRVPELKVRVLLAHLLLHASEPVPVDALVERLWGEQAPADPKASLQAKVSQLRRVLSDVEPGGRELLVSEAAGYRLRVPETALDSGRFSALLDQARAERGARDRAALLDDALALWRGPAFADIADSLAAQPVTARLRERWLSAVEQRAEALLELGEHTLLAGELEEVAAEHPLRERLRAAQMRALYAAGRPNEALTVFEELRVRLRDELGTDPGPDLVDLHGAVLRRSPELRSDEAPPDTRRPLPVSLTELVGRVADTRHVRGLTERARLVTLVGIGGVGKTRLALAVAHEVNSGLPDGARFVGLDALAPTGADTGAAAVTAVAEQVNHAFGAQAASSAGHAGGDLDAVGRLVDAARAVRGLLVLDNCEHVAGGVATLVARLLAAAPELRVLATSREPLEVGGEVLHAVEPLPETEAVRLFADRAAAADPEFTLDEGVAAEVRAICARLDRIPLALELAAARVRGLGLHGLADRLDDRFAVLAGRRRDVPVRQSTLRAVIDWSWELLTGEEQAVLRQLSVFAGGCVSQAAEEVCGGDPAVDRAEVVDVLARLVDRSLVVRTRDGRYQLLESVGAYAHERLVEAGELGPTRQRHLAHYLELAETAAPQLRGREQRAWLARLDVESANLRAALHHAERPDDRLRLVNAQSWFWFLRGRPGEAMTAADTALAEPGGDPALRATAEAWRLGLAHWWSGDLSDNGERVLSSMPPDSHELVWMRWFFAFAQYGFGDIRLATERLRTALRTSREIGDEWGCAAALATEAAYAIVRDDLPAAERDANRAAELFEALGDRWGQLQALDTLAKVAEVTGNYREAQRCHARGLRIAEDLELWPEISGRLSGLGRVSMLTGDLDTARAQLDRGKRLAGVQGNTMLVAYAEFGLALVARRRGELDTAETLLLPWLEQDADAGFASLTPLAELGFIAELRGDGHRALELQDAGYRAAVASGAGPRVVALALEGLAGAWSLLGAHEYAAELLGAADAARRGVGAPLPPAERGDVDRIGDRIVAVLGDRGFADAFAAGNRRPPEDAAGNHPATGTGAATATAPQ